MAVFDFPKNASKKEKLEIIAEYFENGKIALNEVFNEYENDYADDNIIMALSEALSAADDVIDIIYDVTELDKEG